MAYYRKGKTEGSLEKASERRVRLEEAKYDLHDLMKYLANGGGMLAYCNERRLNYGEYIEWIHLDKDRQALYVAGNEARKEWLVERVIEELRGIAFVDLKGMFNEDGTLKRLEDMPEGLTRVIAGIEVVEMFGEDGTRVGYTKKVKMTDKVAALQMLGKNLMMFMQQIRVSGAVTVEHRVDKVDLDERVKMIRERRVVDAVVSRVESTGGTVALDRVVVDPVVVEEEV